MIQLAPFFAREGRSAMATAASRLRAGRGLGGAVLAPKKDGTPFSDALVRLLGAGQLASSGTGFEVRYTDERLVALDEGVPGRQVARPVIGLAQAERAGIVRRATREAARQLAELLRRA